MNRVDPEHGAGEEAADERADDAEHDVPDDAHALVTLDEHAGKVAGDGAEHDPCNDTHEDYLHPNSTQGPVGLSHRFVDPGGGSNYAGPPARCNRLTGNPGPERARNVSRRG